MEMKFYAMRHLTSDHCNHGEDNTEPECCPECCQEQPCELPICLECIRSLQLDAQEYR